ncbi:MAG: carbohydrate ABC transporter substrate-binding protein [Ruminococcus flavefaciens]|nr:carbohydrate ABC transporter substrate-binding protein [Ruminococcus flavefaciens]
MDLWAQNGGDKGKVKFTSFGVGGGDASEKYDALFQSGKDLDVYFCEADWALKYINDDTKTAALEDLGFSEDNFSDVYSYTTEIGRATEGANKGKMVGASWQAAAGGFAYRTDLAEQYLGVKTPEEMQKKINNWDNFVAAATEVATKTDGKVALADSLGGMWQVFAANRKTPWVANGRVAFDQECETFAKYAKTLWDNGGVTKNGQWTDSWIPAGKDGSAMGYFVSTWGFGEKAFFGQASSESYGKWAVVQGPSAYFWGGTWIVVNPKTDNAEEAQQFIYTATVNPETMRKLALDKPEYVNNRTVMQTIVDNNECPNEWVTKDLNGQNYFAELHENAKSIDLKGLITPYDATIKTNFINAVQKEYCEGGASYEDTISKALSDVLTAIPDLAK